MEIDKKMHIEIMRILGALFVIYNHTAEKGFLLFQSYEVDDLRYWLNLFISVFCRFSVPVFFMISGGILLNKKETIGDVWRKRISKTVAVLLIFSFMHFLYHINVVGEAYSLMDFIEKTYSYTWNFSYWYLYSYLAYLVCLPILRVLVENLNQIHYVYILTLALCLLGVVPILEFLLLGRTNAMNESLNIMWVTANIVLYPCMGYFIEHKCVIRNIRKILPWMWVVNILCIGISCYMTYYENQVLGEYSRTFYDCFVLVNSATLYITVKFTCNSKGITLLLKNLILSVGGCTYGIYLLHMLVWYMLFSKIWDKVEMVLGNSILITFGMCAIDILICYGVVLILKKIPLINRLL